MGGVLVGNAVFIRSPFFDLILLAGLKLTENIRSN